MFSEISGYDVCRMTPVFLVISAPSGAGKTTVSCGLLESIPTLRRVVTCTTRSPREGEKNGVDYHFLDLKTFEERVASGDFLEHAQVYGNRYGTLKSSVLNLLQNGFDVILSVDVQGVAAIQEAAHRDAELGQSLVTAFLCPPSLTELERRLRGRGTDSEDVLARRLATARHEVDQWRHFDYVVASGSRESDLSRMQAILAAEKLKTCRAAFSLAG